ncbi:MAG: penicillin-binding protein, partial [Mogibacterium sp.]|nr:penicillin-binding protein [Mogibacterium sp.]
GRISGTSTITQQLSRNVYLADIKSQRSIRRKILEMYYAGRLEHALSKEEIVEAYLNTIYLGHGCYGVNAAAKTYFSKSVKKLSLEQCAALAALPQAPEDYALLKFADEVDTISEDAKIVARDPDTIITNDTSRSRRDLTLRLMLDQGYITQAEYDENVDQSVNSFIKPTITTGNGNYSYYHEFLVDTVIRDLMKEFDMTYEDAERMVYTRGLRIYSTMDSTAQNVVAKEFQDASNFPSVSALYKTDSNGNMLNNDGDIALYKYDNDFDEDGNFTLGEDEVKLNSDGSATILKGKKLNIYETQVDGGTDYSLEFKDYYRVVDDKLYSIQGGYINIPSSYKSQDADGNLVVDKQYFDEYGESVHKTDNGLVFTENAYSLSSMTLQPQGAMVIVENGTGKVKAMVGGRQFKGQKLLNRALNARQPGSSIKPLAVYGAALQKSYELAEKGEKWKFINFEIDKQGTRGWGDYVTVHSSIEDERTYIEDRYWPNNYSRTFSGKNTFKTAIQKSINTCAVKLQLQVGNEFSMNQLKKFGITTAIDDESQTSNDMNPAALALGAMCEGVKPLEMALAYSSFPAGGQLNSAICYTKVEDRNGDILLKGESEKSEALNEGVAFIMTDVLESVVKANGYIHLDKVQAGGKTGTTNDKYDLWFDGFTPSYSASLWIGTDQNVEISSESFQTAQFWGRIMNQIPKALTGDYPKQPSNVISRYGEYFTEGTETGLTSWSSEDEKKKRIAAARQKWQSQRKNHKVWVEEKGHYETRVVSPETYKTEYYDVEEEYTDPETGETKTRTVTKERQVIDKPAVTEKVWVVDKKAHWEYEKGWRDGDFHYDGD